MGRKGKHSGGFNEVTATKVAAVVLPTLIACSKCGKSKTIPNYSKKQLADLRYKILVYGKKNPQGAPPPPDPIKCRTCTGSQVTEMKCIICDETKELEGFAKAQRRTPDEARCINCVDDVQAIEPGLEHREALDSDSDYDDDDSYNPYEDDSMYGSDSGVQLRPHSPSQALTSSRLDQLDSFNGGSENFRSSAGRAGTPRDFEESSVTGSQANNWSAWASAAGKESDLADGGVWVTQNRGNKPFGGKTYTGYDSQGAAHSLYKAPSTTMSERSYEASPAQSGWAKSRDMGPRFPKPARNTARRERQSSQLGKGSLTVSMEEDEDDDEEPFFTL